MTAALDRYRQFESDLTALRTVELVGSPLENRILGEMDSVWWEMTQEERNMLDGEGSKCFPDFCRKPFKDAEAGVNLFWLDGLDQYIYFQGDRGPKLSVVFLVNAGRKLIDKHVLPEPSAVFLVRCLLSPNMAKLAFDDERLYPLVCSAHIVFELPPGDADVLSRIKNDPHFFDGEGTP